MNPEMHNIASSSWDGDDTLCIVNKIESELENICQNKNPYNYNYVYKLTPMYTSWNIIWHK